MKINLTDLCDLNLCDVDMADYPDFVDAYVESARFKSSGRLLTEYELDCLNDEYCGFVQEQVYSSLF